MAMSLLRGRFRPGDRLAYAELHVIVRAVLLAALAALFARFLWVVLTPAGPLGAWQAPAPRLLPSEAQAALLTGYDPFPVTRAAANRETSGGAEAVTDLDLQLFGTRENRGTGMGSAIIAGSDGEQMSFGVGEEVAPGATLAAVGFDYVVIDRGGVRERLYMEGAELTVDASPRPGAAPAPQSGAGTEAAAAAAIPDVQLIARSTNGKVSGIRFGAGVEPGQLAFFGLQQGDVITAVNGEAIDSEADIRSLRSRLKPAARLTLEVERGGQKVPIAVNL